MASALNPDWIAADWGTSNLRVWAMGPEGVMASAESEDGMGKLARPDFEPALLKLVGEWIDRPTRIIACGMVGARQGWLEAPYRAVPCSPVAGDELVPVPTTDPRLQVFIAPGLKQSQPADVMRGEETQIAGALALHPDYDGIFCLPGTHSKWVHVSAGEVVSFQTFMTGELFALISKQSVLRHGMVDAGWDADAFDTGVSDALSRPERLASRLFSLRAEGLLAGLSASAASSRLSGLLIGAELAASKAYWLGQPVTLIGSPKLAELYSGALAKQGVTARALPATECTLAGLAAASRKNPRTA